jgi:hypothetical protein
VSTGPNIDVSWCEHSHHWADRRARRGGRTSSFAGRCCSACNTKLNRRLSGRKGELEQRRVVTCVCVWHMPFPPRCARHSTVCARALCTADKRSGSRAMCSTLRPTGAIVHDEARSEGVCYSASATSAVASLPAGSASADGDHRRHIRRHQQPGEGWGAEWAGPVRRRAECTWRSPASYSASFPHASASCFGVSLHARGCFGFGSAVRRSAALPVGVLDGPVGAAQQQLRDGVGMALGRGKVQRCPPARQTAAATRPAHSADSPQRKRRTRRSSGRSRRR